MTKRVRVTRAGPPARILLAHVRGAEDLETRVERGRRLAEGGRERRVPLLTCSHPRAPIADGGEAFLGQQPVHGQIAHRERVRVSGKARLERLQGDMVRW